MCSWAGRISWWLNRFEMGYVESLDVTDQESRLMLDQGIVMGRGGVFLSLTDEQYKRLKC
jgi:hypothetical protein